MDKHELNYKANKLIDTYKEVLSFYEAATLVLEMEKIAKLDVINTSISNAFSLPHGDSMPPFEKIAKELENINSKIGYNTEDN